YLARHSAPLDSAEHAVITVMEDQLHLDEPKWLARLLPRARPALRTNNRDVQLEAARAGLGLACLPCYTADAASDLQRVASAGFAPPRTVWLGVHADLRQMPRIRALIEVLDAEFRRQKAQLMPPAAAAFTAPASTPPR
ncbi:MAG TPA: LysR substrate-binding domain-containing protein, partial [Novosphingobium sp.]|nr:LysR substrate-binding domain-containing protein [Novosphingobium sp.]